MESGVTTTSRVIFAGISMACLFVLAGLLGNRARQLSWHHFKALNPTRVLGAMLYVMATAFVASSIIVESGLGMTSPSACPVAIFLCVSCYFSYKVIMYMFLVERAHAVRAPYVRRWHDWIWVVAMLVITIGFGTIAVCAFLWPIADIASDEKVCRIGLPARVTIPLLSFDVIITTTLTLIFVYLLRPLLRFSGASKLAVPASRFTKGMRRILASSAQAGRLVAKPVENLLWNSFVGSLLVMLPTIGNLVTLYWLDGREPSWVCLLACAADVTWATCVVHWIVLSPDTDEKAHAIY
ncbi:hypothetical protein BDV95DRAFT_131276 [Massariosphaeria phaeospora]|uniref:G-protein coupled receptors family 1 profile domain-containing protein n=1 Tax=Massariosphaeria phaeospora TaxID=100035 RepID=A0A7C8I5C6_9PLEO|nr:hypothetical protein BDV95DRAFT_131276 [Massariosphaeria phaeospora]